MSKPALFGSTCRLQPRCRESEGFIGCCGHRLISLRQRASSAPRGHRRCRREGRPEPEPKSDSDGVLSASRSAQVLFRHRRVVGGAEQRCSTACTLNAQRMSSVPRKKFTPRCRFCSQQTTDRRLKSRTSKNNNEIKYLIYLKSADVLVSSIGFFPRTRKKA